MQKRENPTQPHPPQGQSHSQNKTGGREFGNVIEPMQAQMASGNRGLADDAGGKRKTRSAAAPQSKKKHA